jgi:isopentenyl phosphate kinase
VRSAEEWRGYAEVSDAAARLNQLVRRALLGAGVPAITLQPSASARCEDGMLVEMAAEPVKRALDEGLVPLLYGDVAFDDERGGTIVSTEEVLGYLAGEFSPRWMLLAGEADGVFDQNGDVIPQITPESFGEIQDALRGSEGTDVTGGMRSKVRAMLALVEGQPGLTIRIFSGMEPDRLRRVLLDPGKGTGTRIGA